MPFTTAFLVGGKHFVGWPPLAYFALRVPLLVEGKKVLKGEKSFFFLQRKQVFCFQYHDKKTQLGTPNEFK